MINFDRTKNLELRGKHRKKAHDLWTQDIKGEEWEDAHNIKRELFKMEVGENSFQTKKFYSYRNFADWKGDEKRLKAEIEDIAQNRITLVRPKIFNDPYDCRLPYSVALQSLSNVCDMDLMKYAEEAINQSPISNLLSTDQKREYARYIVEERKNSFAEDPMPHVEGHVCVIRDLVAVKCLATSLSSMYFWSHYASAHKGYCIEYEIEDSDFDNLLYPVEYVNKWPEDYIKLINRRGSKAAFAIIKSLDWVSEYEWRILYKFSNNEFNTMEREGRNFININCPKGIKITAIYLGLDFNKNDEKLRKAFEDFYKNSDKKVYKMKLQDDAFMIEVGDLIKS
jgi:hypothetical protein